MTPRAFARRYLAGYLPWFAGGTVALAATNWLSVTIPVEVGLAVDALHGPDAGVEIPAHALRIAAMGAAVIAVRSVSRLMFFTPGRLIEARVRQDLFDSLLAQQPAFLRERPVGDLVSRAVSDVNNVRLLVGFGVLQAINVVLSTTLAGAQMARISPLLAGMVVIPIALSLVLTQWSIGRLFELLKALQGAAGALSEGVLSTYQGVATLQAFDAAPTFLARIDALSDTWTKISLERTNLRVVLGPMLGLSILFNQFLLLWVGGPAVVRGELTVGELLAFITLVAMLVNPLRGTSFLWQIWKSFEVSLGRLSEIMDPAPERPDLPNPKPAPTRPPKIVVEGLTFAYPDAPERRVLDGVSFRLPAGGTLGILGATGSGKTTLLRCLLRQYNPAPGTVRVDGVDVREIDLGGWRRAVSTVPQRAFLFSEPLADNIRMGAIGPDGGPAPVAEVLTLAALDADIAVMPDGERTIVGESGLTLSGGQRQRTALARGLFRSHVVLVLDDVLSAVDPATEQRLLATIRSPTDGVRATTVIVANRLSAIRHADVILVLDAGRVVDQGTHDALAARPGIYQDTWERQREDAGETRP